MISGSLAEEGRLLLAAVLQGMGFMAVYDGLRVFRGVVRHGAAWVNVEDFCYWVAVGAAAFAFALRENDGIVRWYVIAGMGAGMLVFSLGISRLTVPAIVWVLQKILWVPRRICGGVFRACRWFGRHVCRRICRGGRGIWRRFLGLCRKRVTFLKNSCNKHRKSLQKG